MAIILEMLCTQQASGSRKLDTTAAESAIGLRRLRRACRLAHDASEATSQIDQGVADHVREQGNARSVSI